MSLFGLPYELLSGVLSKFFLLKGGNAFGVLMHLGYLISFFSFYKGVMHFQTGGLGSFSHEFRWIMSLGCGYLYCYNSLRSIYPVVTIGY